MSRRREKANQPVGTRRAAREFVFRVLFEAEQGKLSLSEVFIRAEKAEQEGDKAIILGDEARVFAKELLSGLESYRAEIDDTLLRSIRGWSFEQMAQTDLNILRLATYEMLMTKEPHPPVIESAVRIARKFGSDDSGRFVNGVLAHISRHIRGEGS